MTPQLSLRTALTDRQLLGSTLVGDTWAAWRCLMIASMGEPLTNDERALFKQLTGREREPNTRIEELVAVVGRRGGKSRAMATLAVYLASLCKHNLVRGERGVALIIAPDQRQANIVLDYASAALEQSPILHQLIANRSNDALTLTNGVSIEVRASSFRRLRGPTYIAVIADEAAFWYSDEASANADAEIINAVRPGLATTDGPLIIASSPYARRGVLYETHKQHFGNDGDPLILVAQGASRTFNPSLPQSVVDRATRRDPVAASAEYLAEFRSDVEFFVDRENVEACVSAGVCERAPLSEFTYAAFCDPSGGSTEPMTIAIAHNEDGIIALDALRERKSPFNPDDVVLEFTALLKSYRITKVQGDRYAGEWPADRFRAHGIDYETSAKPKSDLYRDFLPLINSHRIALLDNSTLIAQITTLERKTARGGKDSIDHAPNTTDDLANATAGVAAMLATTDDDFDASYNWVYGPDHPPGSPDAQWRQQRYFNYASTGGYRRPW